MLVLATFISICVVAVLFLLRFLFALEAGIESRTQAVNGETRAHLHLPFRRSGAGAYASAPALTLVHSNAELAHSSPSGIPDASLHRDQRSQLKEA